MFEQFGNYREIKWVAQAAVQTVAPGDKIQVNPDIDNFRLERFKDLRNHPKINETRHFKLMLIGSSKTNIFIDGPDELLDEMIGRLPKYKSKTWLEIKNMSLERDFLCCKNAFTSLCDPQVINCIIWKPVKPGEPASELEFDKADRICAECKNFEFGIE